MPAVRASLCPGFRIPSRPARPAIWPLKPMPISGIGCRAALWFARMNWASLWPPISFWAIGHSPLVNHRGRFGLIGLAAFGGTTTSRIAPSSKRLWLIRLVVASRISCGLNPQRAIKSCAALKYASCRSPVGSSRCKSSSTRARAFSLRSASSASGRVGASVIMVSIRFSGVFSEPAATPADGSCDAVQFGRSQRPGQSAVQAFSFMQDSPIRQPLHRSQARPGYQRREYRGVARTGDSRDDRPRCVHRRSAEHPPAPGVGRVVFLRPAPVAFGRPSP